MQRQGQRMTAVTNFVGPESFGQAQMLTTDRIRHMAALKCDKTHEWATIQPWHAPCIQGDVIHPPLPLKEPDP